MTTKEIKLCKNCKKVGYSTVSTCIMYMYNVAQAQKIKCVSIQCTHIIIPQTYIRDYTYTYMYMQECKCFIKFLSIIIAQYYIPRINYSFLVNHKLILRGNDDDIVIIHNVYTGPFCWYTAVSRPI